jgi:hypothetical protein
VRCQGQLAWVLVSLEGKRRERQAEGDAEAVEDAVAADEEAVTVV